MSSDMDNLDVLAHAAYTHQMRNHLALIRQEDERLQREHHDQRHLMLMSFDATPPLIFPTYDGTPLMECI